MMRFIQSPGFAALLGGILYLATTAAILNPSHFAGIKPPPPDYSADDDPSWKFRNPELDQWLSQIKSQREQLDLRQQQLDEWQTRLNEQMMEISAATQAVSQLQATFNQNVVRLSADEAVNLKRQTKMLSDMSPEGAVAILSQMQDDDVVRLIFTMKDDVASQILDAWSKQGEAQAKRVADITERLRVVTAAAAPKPQTP